VKRGGIVLWGRVGEVGVKRGVGKGGEMLKSNQKNSVAHLGVPHCV
jgi:hypothetical protein